MVDPIFTLNPQFSSCCIAGLMPGRYFLMVNYNRPEPGLLQPRAPGAEADQSYGSLFYPGVSELGQSTPVAVEAGQELRGMDFRMRRVSTFRIRGKVIDEGLLHAAVVKRSCRVK